MDAPVDDVTRARFYENLKISLEHLDLEGVELTPQTMAPFPWHFGGQRHQNIFIRQDEIVDWCIDNGMRICLDVSHSMLAANHFGYDFYDFCKAVAPHCVHLHLGDASGINGEGLQLGDGEIDFSRLLSILSDHCPNASFIPEIWQGHKNQGEGFWLALKLLEEYEQ
jgi:N-acetylneuraminate synthase